MKEKPVGSFFKVQFDDGFPAFTTWGESEREVRTHFASKGYTIISVKPLI